MKYAQTRLTFVSATLALAPHLLAAGCTGAGAGAADEGSITTATRALSATTQKFVIPLPQSATPPAVALSASSALAIGDRATTKRADGTFAPIVSTGSTTTDLGADSQVGDATSLPTLNLRDRARVNGGATSGANITRGSNTVITGAVAQNASIPIDKLSWNVQFPASGSDVTLSPSATRALAPGSYANVHAFASATLSLRAGTYFMDSLFMEPSSHLSVTTTGGPVFIYIRQGFTFRGATTFTGPNDALLIGYAGTAAPAFDTSFDGTFVAPNASVTLGVGATAYAGAVFAKSVSVMPDVKFTLRPFSGWSAVPFDVIPTLSCVEKRAKGVFAALLGYYNPNPALVTVPVGAQNAFTPSPQNHGQPTAFLAGRFPAEFSVQLATSATWLLDGNALAISSNAPACQTSFSFGLSRDTTVAAAAPAANFGADKTMTIADGSHALVQFDRDAIKKALGVGRMVTKATLVLTRTAGAQPAIDALLMSRAWTESGATWDCANDADATATGESCVAGTGWTLARNDLLSINPWRAPIPERLIVGSWSGSTLSFDVTQDVSNMLGGPGGQRAPSWALALEPGAAGSAVVSSREGTSAPTLVLTATALSRAPNGTGTSAPLSFSVDPTLVPRQASVRPRADGQPRNVAAASDAAGVKTDFVERELMFPIASDAELAPVLAKWNGTIVREITSRGSIVIPTIAVVRINPSVTQQNAAIAALGPNLLEIDNRLGGAHRISSTAGLATIAAYADERFHGRLVGMNLVMHTTAATPAPDYVERFVFEGPYKDESANCNGSTSPFVPCSLEPQVPLSGELCHIGTTISFAQGEPFLWPAFSSCVPDTGSNEVPPPCTNTFPIVPDVPASYTGGPGNCSATPLPAGCPTANTCPTPGVNPGTAVARPLGQFMNIGETWRALALSGHMQANKVPVAIIDCGFAVSHPDYPLGTIVGDAGDLSVQCAGNFPHGTYVTLTGFAAVGNGLGAAGPGGNVAKVALQPTDVSLEGIEVGILDGDFAFAPTLGRAPLIMNMSMVSDTPDFLQGAWNALPDQVSESRQGGTLLFASAGNDGVDIDGREYCLTAGDVVQVVTGIDIGDGFDIACIDKRTEPCQDAGTICVTGLGFDSDAHVTSSQFSGVSSYATKTYTIAGTYEAPISNESVSLVNGLLQVPGSIPDPTYVLGFNGTSAASPFVAGIAALIGAGIDDANVVEGCLLGTAHSAQDGFFTRIPNALAALHCAIGNPAKGGDIPPFLSIDAPADGANVPQFRAGFNVTATDPEDVVPGISWSTSVGTITSVAQVSTTPIRFVLDFSQTGPQVVTATATDSAGNSVSKSINVNVAALTPSDIDITVPNVDGKSFPNGLPVSFVADAHILFGAPCDNFFWSSVNFNGTVEFQNVPGCAIQPTFTQSGGHTVVVSWHGPNIAASRVINTSDVPATEIVSPPVTSGVCGGCDIGSASASAAPVVITADTVGTSTDLTYIWTAAGPGGTFTIPGSGPTVSLDEGTIDEILAGSCLVGGPINVHVAARDNQTGLFTESDEVIDWVGGCVK